MKDCPFCLANEKHLTIERVSFHNYAVICCYCLAREPSACIKEDAKELWNRDIL